MIEYSKHFVCFLDILGFKNEIESSTSDVTTFEKIKLILKALGEVKRSFNAQKDVGLKIVSLTDQSRTIGEMHFHRPAQVCLFSDSIIISYPHSNPHVDMRDLYLIMHEIEMLQYQLLLLGVFVRGGLAHGDLYYEGDICFGPALVEAVNLEKEAIYPRVVMAPYFFDRTSDQFPYKSIDDKLIEENFKMLRDIKAARYFAENPSIYFLDFLYNCLDLNNEAAKQARSVIINELRKPYCTHIRQKYLWLATCFNETLRAYGNSCIPAIEEKDMA